MIIYKKYLNNHITLTPIIVSYLHSSIKKHMNEHLVLNYFQNNWNYKDFIFEWSS